MIYSDRVKMRQASENNTTSRMAQPKQVMYQHFAAIVVNSALLALYAPNARIAARWGMPTAIRLEKGVGCFLKSAAKSEKNYSATNTVIKRNQSPSGQAFHEHDSTSEGDRDPCGPLVAGSER
jgi:hypothetical protein